MLRNVQPSNEQRSLASRRAKPDEYKSVRNALVEEETSQGWGVAKKNRTTTRLKRPKALDKLVEDRVWVLMYRMGFRYLSGQGGAFLLVNKEDEDSPQNQLDVVALDDEVALAIECKSSEQPRKFADFSSVLGKHAGMKKNFGRATQSQFPTHGKRSLVFAIWTHGMILSDNDLSRAKAENVPLLDEKDLEYYETLVSQTGSAARYQFLGDLLEGREVRGLEITVPAIRTKMGQFAAYTFSVSPEYLLKIAFVSHRHRGRATDIDAYQRMLKKSRLKDIRQYISDGGIFPTNIVVNIRNRHLLTFDRGAQEGDNGESTFGWLHIRPAYRVAWIIDGQHRLFAYAGHPLAHKTLVAVMAFVGLPPSEQARLFVDINAEQRKVKQSLLQELYAELHWDAKEPEVRVQAILSKVIQALDTDRESRFFGRILKADDTRTDNRCISLTSIFRAIERGTFFIAKTKKGDVVEYGPLWDVENEPTLRRAIVVLRGYFAAIADQTPELWERGSGDGGGLAMNDGVTVCINLLGKVLEHLHSNKKIKWHDLSNEELLEVVTPYARAIGQHFALMSPDQVAQFRSLRGTQGQTAGTRRLEQALAQFDPTFNPPGLSDFTKRIRAETTNQAFAIIQEIERYLQETIVSELKSEFGADETDWFFSGVPKQVRKKVDDRINEEGGKKGGREENFDLIDYREIVEANWELFEKFFARGKGSKEKRTKWMVEVNELRKLVMHASKGASLPITEEQLSSLEETLAWLEGQAAQPA